MHTEPEPDGNAKIGVDDWVRQVDGRRLKQTSVGRQFLHRWEQIPNAYRYGAALLLLWLFPILVTSEPGMAMMGIADASFVVRVGARFLIFAMLAVGLNVVVGYAGLLDLGYVAFYGIAGYGYAYLSSDFVQMAGRDGIHLPALISIPIIVVATAGIGWLLGTASLRLAGDYLAIVTLAFGQVFLQLALTATRVKFFWLARPIDLTSGPNGINGVDDVGLFGFELSSTTHYYYLFSILLVLLLIGVHRLNLSRIGRGWRALREDELAAEAMGIPTRRMKLVAFALGAAIAALAGSVDAAWQGNVVPNPRYSVLTLINLYAMVVLGGIGSLPGVILGALIFTVLPEVLRNVAIASWLFYGGVVIGLLAALRPWRIAIGVLGGTIAGGALLRVAVILIAPGFGTARTDATSTLNQIVQSWLIIPENYQVVGNVIAICALVMLLGTVLLRSRWRYVMMGITLYLAVFAWETRLVLEPAATRILVVGATLVVLMILRPQGLLGKAEVRIV